MADENPKGAASGKPEAVMAPGQNGQEQAKVVWDNSNMSTSYANVVNISMTREECGLFFGTNLTTGIGGRGELTIRLSDRIIMTPHAAKRLCMLLEANLKAYEERYGKLEVLEARRVTDV